MMVLAGGTFIICSGAVVALLVLNVVVSEKSRALLGFLRNIGLQESAHWLSWWAALSPIMVLGALLGTAAGRA